VNRLPVASTFLQLVQDLRIGGRSSNALYQYTIQADTMTDLTKWGPVLLSEMSGCPACRMSVPTSRMAVWSNCWTTTASPRPSSD